MRVELRHLRYFVAVAEELHFGRAAQRLHIVQPALSRQIGALEREINVTLLDRSKRSVTLTEAGQAFYDEARAILQRVDRATQAAQMVSIGQVGALDVGFIGPAMWSVMPPLLGQHRLRFPSVRFRLTELSSAMQVRQLRERTLDVGFVRPASHDDVVIFETVWREPFVVGLPEKHRLARNLKVDLSELANETFIVVERSASPGYYDSCLTLCQANGFSPGTVEVGNTPAAMYGMVAAGLGITLAPTSACRAPWPGVVFCPLTHAPAEVELAVAYRREEPPPALAAFLETLAQVAGELESPAPVELVSAREQLHTARPAGV